MGKLLEQLRLEMREEDSTEEDLGEDCNALAEMLDAADLQLEDAESVDNTELRHSQHSYRCTMHFLSLLPHLMEEYENSTLHNYIRKVARYRRQYIPEGPPVSPLTPEYFHDWAILDLRIASDEGTFGDLVYALHDELALTAELVGLVDILRNSRMGLYLQTGNIDEVILLRELLTNNVYHLVSTEEIPSQVGDVWFTRLLPCLMDDDKKIVKDTPYLIRDTSESDWLAFFDRNKVEAADPYIDDRLDKLFKFNHKKRFWHDYLVNGFLSAENPHAILLTGIPDLPETLPHG